MRQITTEQTIRILIGQAQLNGFDLCAWYKARISREWPGADLAIKLLRKEGRYYALLFSHEFAKAFWKNGTQMSFVVQASSYTYKNARGEMVTIERKPFTRRTVKPDAWLYHLRQMAAAEDPLRYIRRFLPTLEDVARPKKTGTGG